MPGVRAARGPGMAASEEERKRAADEEDLREVSAEAQLFVCPAVNSKLGKSRRDGAGTENLPDANSVLKWRGIGKPKGTGAAPESELPASSGGS